MRSLRWDRKTVLSQTSGIGRHCASIHLLCLQPIWSCSPWKSEYFVFNLENIFVCSLKLFLMSEHYSTRPKSKNWVAALTTLSIGFLLFHGPQQWNYFQSKRLWLEMKWMYFKVNIAVKLNIVWNLAPHLFCIKPLIYIHSVVLNSDWFPHGIKILHIIIYCCTTCRPSFASFNSQFPGHSCLCQSWLFSYLGRINISVLYIFILLPEASLHASSQPHWKCSAHGRFRAVSTQ